jgi:hypothetical protein
MVKDHTKFQHSILSALVTIAFLASGGVQNVPRVHPLVPGAISVHFQLSRVNNLKPSAAPSATVFPQQRKNARLSR